MKKLNKDKLIQILNTAIKMERRRLRHRKKNSKGRQINAIRRKSNNFITAPEWLNVYQDNHHKQFITFIESIRSAVRLRDKIHINFQNSTHISAAAGLILYAEVDRLIKNRPLLRIQCYFPPKYVNGKIQSSAIVEASLKQIGFFKLIGQTSHATNKLLTVKRWTQKSGSTADGSLAASLLESLPLTISKKTRRKLYRGAIEAIANCVEHAYPVPRKDGLQIDDCRWWMLVGIDEDHLTIIVCDLGVGIPETLPKKHGDGLLGLIKKKFGIEGTSDAEMIRAATFVKQTRTEEANRGKGGVDFRTVVDHFPEALLSIRSNRGTFILTGKTGIQLRKRDNNTIIDGTKGHESISNHEKSILGTVIEWQLSLKELNHA